VAQQIRNEVTVIGGGLAGLSCAVALADAGLSVTVLEAAADLGGRARSWRHQATGDEVDIGPHVVHSEYANFLSLLDRLGTRAKISWQPKKLITLATRRGPYALRHRALPTPFSLLPDMIRAPGLQLRDGLSNLRVTRRALRFTEADVPELDGISGLALLRAYGTTEAMIDWFWRLACMAVMNVPLEQCSAAALMRVHSQLIGHRDLCFGFATVGLSELYARQCVRLIERAGGRVMTGARVLRTRHGPGNGREAHLVATAAHEHLSHSVVYALPPRELGVLRPELAHTDAFVPSPYKSVYLWLDRKFTDEKFWALMWRPDRLNYDFYELANIRPRIHGAASLLASNIIHSHRVEHLSDGEIVSRTLAELTEFEPRAADVRVLHSDVHHIPMAIPCPLLGTEARRPATVTAIPGVFLAGDWVRTRLPCSMESAVRSGYLAAEAVLDARGQRSAIALAPRPNDGLARLAAR
jgi:squalene-associated FAD-dependent desaturase